MEKQKLQNKIFGMCLIAILSLSLSSTVYGDVDKENAQIIDAINPKLILPSDIYVSSKNPTSVNFKVYAIDNVDGKIDVQCDKTPSHVFKLGKTTVRCETEDSAGNKSRGSFIVTVGYNIVQIPTWIKQLTNLWTTNSIDDKTYAASMGFLLQKQIVQVPMPKNPNSSESEIPVWIKSTAQLWIDEKRTDDDFSIVLQWMINRNIIHF